MSGRRKKRNKNQDFLLQGGVLASAAIFGRIIGLIYRIPLTSIIGDLGNNYYGCAFDVYNILLLLSSYSLPMAVSRLIADYRTKGELRVAYRILRLSFSFAALAGGFVCLLVLVFAGFITDTAFQTPQSVYALRALAPALFFTALAGVLRGFFQGMENMRPSAVSLAAEQAVNALVSVLAAYFLASYGMRLGKVLADEDGYRAAYGAAGAAIGTTAGALLSLLFLYVIYKGYLRYFKEKMRREPVKKIPKQILMRSMLFTILPILAASALFQMNVVIEQGIFKHMMADAAPKEQIALWWGVFSGKFKTLVNLPVAVAAAIGTACIPSITSSHVNEHWEAVSEKTELTIRFSMLIAYPSAFGLMLLAQPVMEFLFQDTQPLASGLLLAGGITVVFYSLAAVTANILQGIGVLRAPLIHSGIALLLHMATLVSLLKFTNLGIYAVIAAMAVFGISVMILNQIALYRSGFWAPEFYKTFLLPAVCALIMASSCWVVEFGLSQIGLAKYVTVPAAVAAGIMIYFILLLTLRAVTPGELCLFPGGRRVLRLMRAAGYHSSRG